MKLEKFFKWIQFNLVNYPDISFKTVKMFIDKFYDCLSKKEKERWKLQYQIISEFSLKQISLDSFVSKDKIIKLDNELNNLKKDNNDQANKIQT